VELLIRNGANLFEKDIVILKIPLRELAHNTSRLQECQLISLKS